MRDQKYIKVVLKVVWCEIKVLFQRCLYVERPGQWPVVGGGPLFIWSEIKIFVERCHHVEQPRHWPGGGPLFIWSEIKSGSNL